MELYRDSQFLDWSDTRAETELIGIISEALKLKSPALRGFLMNLY